MNITIELSLNFNLRTNNCFYYFEQNKSSKYICILIFINKPAGVPGVARENSIFSA
jgi:hypothetical protein